MLNVLKELCLWHQRIHCKEKWNVVIILAARNLEENIGKGKGNGKGEDKPTRSRAMRYLK